MVCCQKAETEVENIVAGELGGRQHTAHSAWEWQTDGNKGWVQDTKSKIVFPCKKELSLVGQNVC